MLSALILPRWPPLTNGASGLKVFPGVFIDSKKAPEERADDWRIFDAAVRADLIAQLSAEALQSVGAEALVRSLSERGGASARLKIGDELRWYRRDDRAAELEAFASQHSEEALIDTLPEMLWKTGNPAEDARMAGEPILAQFWRSK